MILPNQDLRPSLQDEYAPPPLLNDHQSTFGCGFCPYGCGCQRVSAVSSGNADASLSLYQHVCMHRRIGKFVHDRSQYLLL